MATEEHKKHDAARLEALKHNINEKLADNGPEGRVTPRVLRELFLEIVDILQKR